MSSVFAKMTHNERRMAKELFDMNESIHLVKIRPWLTVGVFLTLTVAALVYDPAMVPWGFAPLLGLYTYFRFQVSKAKLKSMATTFHKIFLNCEYARVIRMIEEEMPAYFDAMRNVTNEYRNTSM